jgi:hypothetical protein
MKKRRGGKWHEKTASRTQNRHAKDGIFEALERESGATLAHAALDDTAAVLALQTSTKPMGSYALCLLWLVVSLHAAKIARIFLVFKALPLINKVIHRL